jgi:hypothetical protein
VGYEGMAESGGAKQQERPRSSVRPARERAVQKQLVSARRGATVSKLIEEQTKDGGTLQQRAAVRSVSGDEAPRVLVSTESRFAHDFSRVPTHTTAPQTRPGVQAQLVSAPHARNRSPVDEAPTRPQLTAAPHSIMRDRGRAARARAIDVLNRMGYYTPQYEAAVLSWPGRRPLWPHLNSRRARENLIRYIVHFDMTQCRPSPHQASSCRDFERAREMFRTARGQPGLARCQAFASQMYVRYSDAPRRQRLSRGDIRRLASTVRVYRDDAEAKFRMPIFIVQVPGHAFNAIQVGSEANDINSYLFLEAATDKLFDANSAILERHLRVGILGLSRLTGFSEEGGYEETPVADFVRGGSGPPTRQRLTNEQRIALRTLMRDLFIAGDWPTWRTSVAGAGPSELTPADYRRRVRDEEGYRRHLIGLFESYIRRRTRDVSNEMLAFAGRFVVGRQFARYPWETPEVTLDRGTYIRLVGRSALRRLMRGGSPSSAE